MDQKYAPISLAILAGIEESKIAALMAGWYDSGTRSSSIFLASCKRFEDVIVFSNMVPIGFIRKLPIPPPSPAAFAKTRKNDERSSNGSASAQVVMKCSKKAIQLSNSCTAIGP